MVVLVHRAIHWTPERGLLQCLPMRHSGSSRANESQIWEPDFSDWSGVNLRHSLLIWLMITFRTFSVVASLVVIAVEGAPFENRTHRNEDGSGDKLGDDGHNATSSTTTPAWNMLTEMRPTVPPDHRKLARTVFGITATTCAGLLVIVVIQTGWRYTYYKCTDEGPCCCCTHHSTTSGESVLRTVCSLQKKAFAFNSLSWQCTTRPFVLLAAVRCGKQRMWPVHLHNS